MIGFHGVFFSCVMVAVQASLPLSKNFTSWGWLSSVVVGNYLYIEGGESYVYNLELEEKGVSAVNLTLAIDLSKSWTNASVSAISNERGSGMSTSRRPLLWYNADNQYVYEWSGWNYGWGSDGSAVEDADSAWRFSPDGNGGSQWVRDVAPTTNNNSIVTSWGSSAVYTPAAFYSLGGTLVPSTTFDDEYKQPVPDTSIQGLLSLDFASNTWTNTSSADFFPSGYSVLGEAAFVPNFGQTGLLVFLGGDSPSDHSYDYQNASALVDMATIPVYDIHTGTWYHQVATGDVPRGRTGLCAVGTPTADNGSYEIFMYGGFSNTYAEGLDSSTSDYEDVFILSLPAFNWFRAPAGPRRAYHTCQLVGGRQMISVGGFPIGNDHKPSVGGNITDSWTTGIGIFNMTDLRWSSVYDPSQSPYEQSRLINQYYQTSPGTPAWTNPGLAEVFATNTSSKSSTATKAEPTTSKHGGTKIGAIVGGVIGGVAGLCAVLAFATFLLRQRRRNTDEDEAQSSLQVARETSIKETNSYSEMSGEPKVHQLGPSPAHELSANTRSELN